MLRVYGWCVYSGRSWTKHLLQPDLEKRSDFWGSGLEPALRRRWPRVELTVIDRERTVADRIQSSCVTGKECRHAPCSPTHGRLQSQIHVIPDRNPATQGATR